MNSKALLIGLILFFFFLGASFSREKGAIPAVISPNDSIYTVMDSLNSSMPDREVFNKAMQRLESLSSGKQEPPQILSIIDFTKPSSEKRFWIIDLKSGRVLHHTLVAHGKNSGELYAKRFSNTPESYQSSLGLFVTGKTYKGKHGLSLKLHGLEPGVNDRAEARAIVIHAADYVSEQYVKKTGRLGRSFGCPAIPFENHEQIINTLADGTCLYIHYSSI